MFDPLCSILPIMMKFIWKNVYMYIYVPSKFHVDTTISLQGRKVSFHFGTFSGKKCHFSIGLRGKRPNPNRFLHKMEIFSAILVRSRPNLNGRFPTHKYMFHVNFMVIDPFPF